MQKLPAKYTALVTGLLMSLFMCTMMSFAMTTVLTGFADGFLFRWGKAFTTAFIIATPTVLLVQPIVRRLVSKLVQSV